MSVRIMADVWASSAAKGNDRLVLLALADHANDEDRQCWPSLTHVAKKCQLSRTTVRRCVYRLAIRGELRLVILGSGRSASRYEIWDPTKPRIEGCQIETSQIETSQIEPPGVPPVAPQGFLSSETLTIKEPSKNHQRGRRLPATPFPDGFQLDPEMLQYALDGGMTETQAKFQFQKFKVTHMANDSRFRRWNWAWFKWVRNWREFAEEKAHA